MSTLNYGVPFTGFSHMGFLSCMAGVHTYLNILNAKKARPNAWGYGTEPGNIQEDWYFTLGTLCGKNSTIEPFDTSKNTANDQTIYADFCMKFCGYNYMAVESADEILSAAADSIDKGFPAIAVTAKENECRVIIGEENGKLIFADKTGAQGDNAEPTLAEIRRVYIITERTEPEYSLIDGLKNMERSLLNSIEVVWEETRSNFPGEYDDWDRMYQKEDFEKTKAAFARLLSLMWNFDHCHNVSSSFAHKVYAPLQDDRLAELCREIDNAYYDAHNMQWAMQSMYDLRDWSKREWYSKEFGMFMFADMGIERLINDDKKVLAAVRKMIEILEK